MLHIGNVQHTFSTRVSHNTSKRPVQQPYILPGFRVSRLNISKVQDIFIIYISVAGARSGTKGVLPTELCTTASSDVDGIGDEAPPETPVGANSAAGPQRPSAAPRKAGNFLPAVPGSSAEGGLMFFRFRDTHDGGSKTFYIRF